MKHKWLIIIFALLVCTSFVLGETVTFTSIETTNSKPVTVDKTDLTMTVPDRSIILPDGINTTSTHQYLITLDDTKNNKVRELLTHETNVKLKKEGKEVKNLKLYPVTAVKTINKEITIYDTIPIPGYKITFYNYTDNQTNTTLTGNYTTAYLLRYDYIPIKHNLTSYEYTYDTSINNKSMKTKKGAVTQYILELHYDRYVGDQFNITFTLDGIHTMLIDPDISACGAITTDNSTYTITQNIGTGTSICLDISANNVVIDGLGNTTITGGIRINSTNVTIQNVTITQGFNESINGSTQGQYNRIGIKGNVDTKIYNVNITNIITPTGATGPNGGSGVTAKPGNYSGNIYGIYDDYNLIVDNVYINNLATGNGGLSGSNGGNGVNTCYTPGSGAPSGNLYGIYASTTSTITNVNINNVSIGKAGNSGNAETGYTNPCNGAYGGSAGNLTGIYANTTTINTLTMNNLYAGGGGNAGLGDSSGTYVGAGGPGGDSGRIIGLNIQGQSTLNTITIQNMSIGIAGNGTTGYTGSYTGTDGGSGGNAKLQTPDGGFIYGIISNINTTINGLTFNNAASGPGGIASNGGSSGNQLNGGGVGGQGGDSGSIYIIYGNGIIVNGIYIQNIQTNTPVRGGSGGSGPRFSNVGLMYMTGGHAGDSGDIDIVYTFTPSTLSNSQIYNLSTPNGADNIGITSGSGDSHGGKSGYIYILNSNDTTTVNNVTLNLATTGSGGNSPNTVGTYASTIGQQSDVGGNGGYFYGIKAYTANINILNIYNVTTGNGGSPGTMIAPNCYQCGSSSGPVGPSVTGTPGADGGIIYVAYLQNTSIIRNIATQKLVGGNGSRAQNGMYGMSAQNQWCGGNGGQGGISGAAGTVGLYITGTQNNISGIIIDNSTAGIPGPATNGGAAGDSGGSCYGGAPYFIGPTVAGAAGPAGTNWKNYALYVPPGSSLYFYNFICKNYVDISTCYYPAINYTLSFSANSTSKQRSGANSTLSLNATVSNVSYNTSVYLNNLSQEMLVGSYYLSVSIGSNNSVTIIYPQDTSVTSQTGYNSWGTGPFYVDSSSNGLGFAIYTNNTMAHSVTVSRYNASVTTTRCVLRSSPNGTNIATGTFSGDNCTMNYTMLPNTQYYVLTDANGSSYTRYQPLTYHPSVWGGSWGRMDSYTLITNVTVSPPTKAFWTYLYGWYGSGSSDAYIFQRYDYTDGTSGDSGAGNVPGYSPTLMGFANPSPDKTVYAVETWARNAPRSFTISGVTLYIGITNTTTSSNGIMINGGVDNGNSSNSTGNLASITYNPFNNQQTIYTNANPQTMSGIVTLPSIDNTTIGWRYYAYDKAYTQTFESPIFLLTTIPNALPIVSSVTLIPSFPYSTTTLQAYCTATDADTASITYNYKWYKNGILFTNGTLGSFVPQNTTVNLANLTLNDSITTVDDNWTIGCIPDDNIDFGVEVISNVQTIIDFTIFFNNGTTPTNTYLLFPTINISITSLNNGYLLGNTIYVYDYLGNIEYSNFTNQSDFNITYTGLLQGTHYFNATTVQTNLSQKWTETRQVFVDAMTPSISYGAGTDPSGSYFNRTYILFSTSVFTSYLNRTENKLYYQNGSLAQMVLGENQLQNFSGLSDGIYYFNSTAYTNSGLYNSTETRNVTIIAQPPGITFISPTLPDGTYTLNHSLPFGIAVSGPLITNYAVSLFIPNITTVCNGLPDNTGHSAYACYQESPIIANQTGIDGICNVSSAGYSFVDADDLGGNRPPRFYETYTLPPYPVNNITWSIKYGGVGIIDNVTIPTDCIGTNVSILIIGQDGAYHPNYNDAYCTNISDNSLIHIWNSTFEAPSGPSDFTESSARIHDGNWNTYACAYAIGFIVGCHGAGNYNIYETAVVWDIPLCSQVTNKQLVSGIPLQLTGAFTNLTNGTYYLQGSVVNVVGSTNTTEFRTYIIYNLTIGTFNSPTFNQTLSANTLINYTGSAATNGNVNIQYYLINLLNADHTFNQTIINNGLNTTYVWNALAANLHPGQYYIEIVAVDNK